MADQSLILDRRADLEGKPGLHAVLIGVSEYAHLPSPDDPPGEGLAALKKLRSSAVSALALLRKLRTLNDEGRLVRPLKTVRFLQSPSPEEVGAEPSLAGMGAPATREIIAEALQEWRDDAAEGPASQTLFYFCGHGIRRSLEESILLTADFLRPGLPKLFNSFRVMNIRNGMVAGPSYPDLAREQFYFIDACREKPDALDQLDTTETPKIFDAELNNTTDDRRAPVFFSTLTGGLSAGVANQPSYFVQALIWAMDHGSFEKRKVDDDVGVAWPMTPPSLKAAIEVAKAFQGSKVELTGLVGEPALCFRRDAPQLPVEVALAPEPLPARVQTLTLTELNTNARHDITPVTTNGPHALDLAAGMYRITVKPRSRRFQRSESDVLFLSIRSPMPLVFDLGAAP